ncbi:MAG: ATP-binding protein, partial [Armatimonadota bacterium]
MPTLPTGTVTFLFTDIEGSLGLIQRSADAASQAFAEHGRLLRDAVESGGGHVYQDQGERFLFVFERAKDALLAAIAVQRALAAHRWPEGITPRVRMGLHSGEPTSSGHDYVGLDVHRAVRICAAGHGGQILLSQTTRDLVEADLPTDMALRDLGNHRLKDLLRPEHIFQLVPADLQGVFPPLVTLDVLPNNLPVQLTSLVGREREIAEVNRLLPTTPLLTLTGAGGCGKTRLALQVAADVLEAYADGVWFVDLAPISDPALVPRTVASALGVREQPGRSMLAVLTDYLGPKHLLLILDNCEHLLSECAQLTDGLLRVCLRLRILATSRQGLGIAGELTYRVPSLSVPDLRDPGLNGLMHYGAVRLFVERATFASPTFALTPQKTRAVAQICARLDGIPLAIELAAVRVKAMGVEQIASRLDDRFHLLTGGSRTALPRQQTLRGMIDWSYDLLPEPERAFLRRLAIFAGGFTLEAAEAVCTGDGIAKDDVIELLTHLVEKSLVISEEHDGHEWYRALETIRQYGLRRLQEAGEEPVLRDRHRDWYLGLAERAEIGTQGAAQGEWLDRVEREHDNFRAALEWSKTTPGGADERLRLAGALWFFWFMRGYLSEGRDWLEGALSASPAAPPSARAKALNGAGLLAWRQGDDARAAALGEQGLALCRQVGYQLGVGSSLHTLGLVARRQGDDIRAAALCEESLAVVRAAGYKWGIAHALDTLGDLARHQGDYDRAATLLEESLDLFRELKDNGGIASSLYYLGLVALQRGDPSRASTLFEECLSLFRGLKDKGGIAWALHHLGSMARDQGAVERAAAFLQESLAAFRELGQKSAIAASLERLGGVAAAQGRWSRAARLFGAADALRQASGSRQPASVRADAERDLADVRAKMGEQAFASAWAHGRAMALEQAV